MTKIVIENSRTIPLLSEHFANLCWVCKAAAKAPDIREYVKQKIHAQDGILCATDGHRLHLYLQDLDSLPESVCVPDGLWEIKSKNGKLIVLERVDNEELVFPNYWNVFSPKALQIGRYDALSAWLGHQVIPRPCGMSDDPGRPYRSGDMGRFAQPDSAR